MDSQGKRDLAGSLRIMRDQVEASSWDAAIDAMEVALESTGRVDAARSVDGAIRTTSRSTSPPTTRQSGRRCSHARQVQERRRDAARAGAQPVPFPTTPSTGFSPKPTPPSSGALSG